MAKTNLLNEAWGEIFDKHDIINRIIDKGHVHIHANDIKVFREPRLMTKFDHYDQLPELFKVNGLTILPTSRGGYIIGEFKTFHKFEQYDAPPVKVAAPTFLESLDFNNVSSESFAINCAYASRILHMFTGEDELFPTVNGRMASSIFNFNISTKSTSFRVDVRNSQLEIDGGFEGMNSLTLLEAKNYIADDFLVRQLFYPYKLWSTKIAKPVRPIFLSYTNGIFHLREYVFEDVSNYNSIRLVDQRRYTIQHVIINYQTIQDILSTVPSLPEPEVPFPQADSFKRVVNLGELLMENGIMTTDAITRNYMFDGRQTQYYFNALRYLGFAERIRVNGVIVIKLSDEGRRVYSKDIDSRQIEFITAILSRPAFKITLESYFRNGEMPLKEQVVDTMMKVGIYGIKEETTYYRRSSTIIGWVNWIVSVMEE